MPSNTKILENAAAFEDCRGLNAEQGRFHLCNLLAVGSVCKPRTLPWTKIFFLEQKLVLYRYRYQTFRYGGGNFVTVHHQPKVGCGRPSSETISSLIQPGVGSEVEHRPLHHSTGIVPLVLSPPMAPAGVDWSDDLQVLRGLKGQGREIF